MVRSRSRKRSLVQTEGWGGEGTEWRQGERSGGPVISRTITQGPRLGQWAGEEGQCPGRDSMILLTAGRGMG